MSKQYFIPLNRKSIESSNAISFGAYKDEDDNWKGTGDSSSFLIQHGNNRLNFYANSDGIAEQTISDWKKTFHINTSGFGVLGYGNLQKVIELNDGLSYYTLTASDNNALLFCIDQSNITIPETYLLPIGFTFSVLKDDVAETTALFPEGSVVIYGRRPATSGDNVVEWSAGTGKKPVLYPYNLVYVRKLTSLHWNVCGGHVDQTTR